MKLTRDRLKKIIKEELEAVMQEDETLQEGVIENFVSYLNKVVAAKSSTPMTEAGEQNPEAQQKVSDFKNKVGAVGMGVIKGATSLGLDMALIMAIFGYKFGMDPADIAMIIPIMAGGGLVGGLVGSKDAGRMGVAGKVGSAIGGMFGKK